MCGFRLRIDRYSSASSVNAPSVDKPPPPAANFRTAPTHPNFQDVSLKNINFQDTYGFFRGNVTTEVQRDAMEETLTGKAIPELIRLLEPYLHAAVPSTTS